MCGGWPASAGAPLLRNGLMTPSQPAFFIASFREEVACLLLQNAAAVRQGKAGRNTALASRHSLNDNAMACVLAPTAGALERGMTLLTVCTQTQTQTS